MWQKQVSWLPETFKCPYLYICILWSNLVCLIRMLTAVPCYVNLNLVRNVTHNCYFNRNPLLELPVWSELLFSGWISWSCRIRPHIITIMCRNYMTLFCISLTWNFVFPISSRFLSDSTVIISSWTPNIVYLAITDWEKKQLFCLQCFMN